MFLGSKSNSTVLDVFRVGFGELFRQNGLPEEVHYRTDGCEIRARAEDMTKRVDVLQVAFPVRPGVQFEQIAGAMETSQIGGHVKITNGTCALTLPAFEWPQLPQLDPVDKMVQEFARRSVRSQSWDIQINRFKNHNININDYHDFDEHFNLNYND